MNAADVGKINSNEQDNCANNELIEVNKQKLLVSHFDKL